MEQIYKLLVIVATIVSLFISTVTFLTKFIKSIKARDAASAVSLMTEFAQMAVAEVEVLKGKSNGELTGVTKKELAMTKVQAACLAANVPFDAAKASDMIEKTIALTKIVNARKAIDAIIPLEDIK